MFSVINYKENTESKVTDTINRGGLAISTIFAENNQPMLDDPNLKVGEVINGLFLPTFISFLGESDFIILQKNGTVSRVINGTLTDKPLLNLNI